MLSTPRKKIVNRIVFLFTLFLLCSEPYAKTVRVEEAKKAADTFLKAQNVRVKNRVKALQESAIKKTIPKKFIVSDVVEIHGNNGQLVAYVSVLEPEGFIITAADSDIKPILGYSFKGKFPFVDSKQNVLLHLVQWDVQARSKALSSLSEEAKNIVQKNNKDWQKYLAAEESLVHTLSGPPPWPTPYYGCKLCGHKQDTPVICEICNHSTVSLQEGWIATKWDQGWPYNAKCPLNPTVPDQRCLVGCVATAMAQIANYWKYPNSVWFDESDRYTSRCWGYFGPDVWNWVFIDIDEQADLLDFPDFDELNSYVFSYNLSDQPDYPEYLSFAAGIKLHMGYSSKISGCFLSSSAYTAGFNYGSADTAFDPTGISWHFLWQPRVIENIKKGWPVQIGINTSPLSRLYRAGGGHSVVVDGYKSTGEFHINCGWEGEGDWWYYLPIINTYIAPIPGKYYFDMITGVVLDICPYQGWHQWGSDEKNTFNTPYVAPITNPPVDKWQVTCLSSTHYFTGLVVGTGNRIYASCSPRSRGGSELASVWVINKYGVKQPDEIILEYENVAITYPCQNKQGEVFVASELGRIYKIDVETNAETRIFTEPSAEQFLAPIKIDSDDYIYAFTLNDLYSLTSDGTERWTFQAPSGSAFLRLEKPPAIDTERNRVYLGYYDLSTKIPYLACIDRGTGNLIYPRAFPAIPDQSYMTGTPSIGPDGTVYVGCGAKLYALNPDLTLSEKWSKDILVFDAPAVKPDGTRLYTWYRKQVDTELLLVVAARDATDGSVIWEIEKTAEPSDRVGDIYLDGNDVVSFTFCAENGSNPDTFTIFAYMDDGESYEYLWEKELGASGGMVAFGPGATLYTIPIVAGYGSTIYAISEGACGDPDGGGMAYTDNSAPLIASNPDPLDGKEDMNSSVILSWDCSDPEVHDLKYSIFIGESGYDMVPLVKDINDAHYHLDGLRPGTGYAWKIIATDGQAVSEGPTWVFATKPMSPDLNGDKFVNFFDYAILANLWLEDDCNDPNWCEGADLDWSGDVNWPDVGIISNEWLEGYIQQMVLVPAGEFLMGDDSSTYNDERPVHSVKVDSFYMSKYEVTYQEYCDYLNYAYSQNWIEVNEGIVYGHGSIYPYSDSAQIHFVDPVFSVTPGKEDHPMEHVSWYGSAAYCNWLSQRDGFESCYDLSTWDCDFSKNGYRLATEAEWEYAARGGLSGNQYPWGDDQDVNRGNWRDSGDPYETGPQPWTTPIGFYDDTLHDKADYNWPGSQTSYQTSDGSSGYGLFDMAGGVAEWCHDWYDAGYYSTYPYDNPVGPPSSPNNYRLLRGGGWANFLKYCRVAYRSGSGLPGSRGDHVGFRVVLDLN